MVVFGRLQLELHEDVAYVRFDRLGTEVQPGADRRVCAALCHQLKHLPFAHRELLDRVPVAAASHELGYHIRIDHRTPGGNPPNRIAEFGNVAHVVFQQVADTTSARDQLHHVMSVDILRKDEHAKRRERRSYLSCCDESLRRERRRHPDVEDGDVGSVGPNKLHERLRIGGLADYIEPKISRNANQTLAKQSRVVDDRQSQGISATRCVPAPAGLLMEILPPIAAVRSSRPWRPPPPAGSAPPTPSSLTSITKP